MASCPEFVVALAVVAVVFFGYLGAVVDHFAVCLNKVVPPLPPGGSRPCFPHPTSASSPSPLFFYTAHSASSSKSTPHRPSSVTGLRVLWLSCRSSSRLLQATDGCSDDFASS